MCIRDRCTIGFGDLTPQTSAGQFMAVILSLVGITLFSATVDTISAQRKGILAVLSRRWVVSVVVCPMPLVGLAAIMTTVEGWGWSHSLYFVATTASTTGYGDIVPKTSCGKLVVVLTGLYSVTFFVFFVTCFKAAFMQQLYTVTVLLSNAREGRPWNAQSRSPSHAEHVELPTKAEKAN
eukprot:TRINITY_DN49023_c0_g1_i4.p2 TRINITY_DN49023_c0_g1~~TRINITY_DN49023_c0_g1_i4.p2  ORF type:complete len:180 (-),score=40.45 TRINITY_DN49023_c0_g1_i4:101-640(-)